jgi:hypothetical protein
MRAGPADLLGRLDRVTVGLDSALMPDLQTQSVALRQRLAAAAAMPPRQARRSSAELQTEVRALTVEILRRLADSRSGGELAQVVTFARPAATPRTVVRAHRHAG